MPCADKLTMRRLICLLCLFSTAALAEVSSETVFFIQPDGRHYLLERAIHSDNRSHRFHLPKGVQPEQLLQVSPAHYDWDDSDPALNTLSFDAGGFSLIYPGEFSERELKRLSDGEWQYRSWDGKRDASGRYGYWYSPGDFDRYTYTWILPDNIELTRYRSNRDGTWTHRPHAISFYAEKVNNLTFEMGYRVRAPETPQVPPDTGPAAGRHDPITPCPEPVPTPAPAAAPQPAAPTAYPSRDMQEDADRDGVPGGADLCPGTPRGALVDRAGCPLDTDRDGVPDGIDRCTSTPEETPVDASGCKRPN